MSPMARAPLTSVEKTTLEQFARVLKETESQFCCGGSIQVSPEQKLKLFYNLGTAKQAYSITFPTTDSADISKLLEACYPAPHGRGAETVYDDSYRLARELNKGDFALTADVVNNSGILDHIKALTSPRVLSGKLGVDLYKLNSYSTGGFFKSHRDTPKSGNHIGTLVIGLPVPFAGGALRVSHEGNDMLFDLNKTTASAADMGHINLPWVFLFSDVEHEVLPVTSGTRVTLAYDIFIQAEPDPAGLQAIVDGTTLPLYSDLEAMLKKQDFLPQGGKLGLGLSHCYPVNIAKDSNRFASHFKGRDAVLHRALLALKIPISIRAVYGPDDSERENHPSFPDDGFGPFANHRLGSYETILYTAKEFHVVESYVQWDEGEAALLEELSEATVESDIIWVYRPPDDSYTESGTYIAYGNEASLSVVYVAAALVLEFPPAGEGARASI